MIYDFSPTDAGIYRSAVFEHFSCKLIACQVTYKEPVELDICGDVHQIAVELDICLTRSPHCRQILQPAIS